MKKTDWKKLTYELTGALYFAINHLDARGAGLVLNIETGKSQTWQRYLATELAKVPGVKIDWEAVDALALPSKQRRAYFDKKRKKQPAKDRGK